MMQAGVSNSMAKKPTHVIVEARPARVRLALYLAVAVLLLAGGWALFDYGRARAGFDARAARDVHDELVTRIAALEEDNKRLSGQNAVLEQAREVDRRAYEEVDHSLAGLQDELSELKQEAAFYRRLVNVSDTKGLQIESMKLQRDAGTGEYRFHLILTQYTSPPSLVQGEVKISVEGLKNGAQTELSPRELMRGDKSDLTFRFRHFQEFTGSLVLPDGFVPLRLILRITPREAGRPPLERGYVWNELFS